MYVPVMWNGFEVGEFYYSTFSPVIRMSMSLSLSSIFLFSISFIRLGLSVNSDCVCSYFKHFQCVSVSHTMSVLPYKTLSFLQRPLLRYKLTPALFFEFGLVPFLNLHKLLIRPKTYLQRMTITVTINAKTTSVKSGLKGLI